MGGALARAVISLGEHRVLVSDYLKEKADAFASEYGAEAAVNARIASNCDIVFIAVKPNVYSDVLPTLVPHLTQRTIVVSIAAGIKIEAVKKLIGEDKKVIRIMPNTPVAVGEGMILYDANANVTEAQIEAFANGLSAAGCLDRIPLYCLKIAISIQAIRMSSMENMSRAVESTFQI